MCPWTEPWRLDDEQATLQAGRALAQELRPGDRVALQGDLGAGKTCLTRGLMEALYHNTPAQERAWVSSPTYTLVNLYPAPAPWGEVAHFDLYRLHDVDDLESTGYWDTLAEAELAIIEWIDQVPEAWPEQALGVWLQHQEEGRLLRLSWRGEPEEGRRRLQAVERALSEAGLQQLKI